MTSATSSLPKTFNLPIVRVVALEAGQADAPLDPRPTRAGVSVNSRNDSVALDGHSTTEAKLKITDWLEKRGIGKKTVNYKLRDWLFSRQRYWGEPFPVVLDANDQPTPFRSRSCRFACPSWKISNRPASPSRP